MPCVLGLAACGGATGQLADRKGETNGTAFELSTSGTDFTDEYGQWTVRVRGDAMWIAQSKGGKSREFGTFQLSRKEANKLWGYIEDARLHRRPEGRDLGPQRAGYTLTILRPKKLAHTVNLTMGAVARDGELDDLVAYVQKLVRKYTRKKAVLRPPS